MPNTVTSGGGSLFGLVPGQQSSEEMLQRPAVASCWRHSEMGIYRDNLSAIIYYRLSLLLKIVFIYRFPMLLL